ncbi:unnamed protein product [Paramecium sonneborni]|uniref:Cyclic nucleotide-binding domain-containing protein n=1 Tax=Paramecium sonneborni TaxID=65129 RepID=A0A8S1Q0L8_9CILI|nr:unnamed protein product [Paramecium sonneborni]
MLVQPHVNGQQGSSSRSMSISMDDSIYTQIQPIVQKMTVVNQHQLQVRKPSDGAQELLKSPPTTSVTPQIASDRPLQSEIKDLLLINEEPSNKEQSMQISDRCKRTHKNTEKEISQQSIVIDEKPQHSYSDVQWSRLMSLRTVNTHPSFQLNVLCDKAAEIDQINYTTTCLNPKKQNLYYHFSNVIYCMYLCFFITQILINLQHSFQEQQIYQILLIVFQIISTLNQVLFQQQQNGQIIQNVESLIQIYLKKQLILDLIVLIPVILALSTEQLHILQLLHIIRLRKLRQLLKDLEIFYGAIIQYIYYIIEFHFVQFIALTILQFNHDKQFNFYDEFIVLFYKSSDSNLITYVIRMFILIYYCFFIYRLTLKDNFQINKLSLSYETKQMIRAYINKLKSQQSVDMNFLSQLPQSYVDDVKFQRYSHLLQKIPIFKSSFSQSTMRQICSLIEEYTYIPNQIVLMQQTSNQQLFIILSGEVQITQRKEGSSIPDFKIKIIGKDSIFNSQAFFRNTYSNVNATSIGYSQIAQLDIERFQECIKFNYEERQKYKMMVDQIVLYKFYSLCSICCYLCGKFHDIDECDHVHYVPKQSVLVQYIQSNDQQIRRNYFRSKMRQKQRRIKSSIMKIEEAALLFQQLNIESDNTDDHKKYQDEVISIQQPQMVEVSHHLTDRQNSLQQSQQTPRRGSLYSMRESLHSLQQQQQQQQQQHQLMDIPNISPVQYVQQPPSGISHSSYGQLLKDVSVNRKNFNGSSDKNSSGNVFSLPYSSNGSKNTPNNIIQKQEKDELISIQLKMAKFQDSVYYHQKRIHNQIDNQSQNTLSKYQKYHTTQPQQQQQTQTVRSDRKSNSCISESEKGEYQIQQQQEVQPSRYGIQSSKFTGETAKQFMRNPLEMPNIEFYQSFEKSNQFSDYFPQHNINQAIESYKQYQQSRSSVHK